MLKNKEEWFYIHGAIVWLSGGLLGNEGTRLYFSQASAVRVQSLFWC